MMQRPYTPIRSAQWAIMLIAIAAASRVAAEERLVDLPAFDVVVLNAANNNAELKVEPLKLPDRRLPAAPEGNLRITLVDDPTQQLEVPWTSISNVKFFEHSLLAEARRLTQEKQFDEAFDYFARLSSEYPQLTGFDEARSEYLRNNALALFQSQQLDRALAVLMSLYDQAPDSPGLGAAVDAICGRMVEQQLRQQDYAGARAILDMWRDRFRGLNSQAVLTWEQRFETAARRQIVEARKFMAVQDYSAARKAIGKAHDIWPDSADAQALLGELQQAYPAVIVGVLEPSPVRTEWRIDDWASLRASRLTVPLVAELVDFSSEGGVYRSPFGEWVADESGTRLSLQLKSLAERGSGFPSADFLARFFLDMADATRTEYRPEFARLFAGVSIEGDEWIHLDWKRPHVRPESLLQVPLPIAVAREEEVATDVAVVAPFALSENGQNEKVYSAKPIIGAPQAGVRTVVEQTMPSDDAAIAALIHGEIDVLDRVPPWQIGRLRAANGVRVASYRLPTVHVLLPNPQNPLVASREFRRALSFAIERDRIVDDVILGGEQLPGYQLLTGPFPAGVSFSDPLRYAYNNQLTPRAYEPRLGAVLAAVAWAKVLDPTGSGDVELTEMPALVLAHPIDPVARLACETIKLQLERAGFRVELKEFTADELLAGTVEYDLRYAELAVWEPLADVQTLFGADGLAGKLASPYLETAMRQLGGMSNWKDVRAKLAEIHDVAHHDLPLIPLWQTVNYFAYRTSVQGIGESPVALYQNVDSWRVEPSAATETASTR
jgi:tetratricopeptide (TPR) repeat protein